MRTRTTLGSLTALCLSLAAGVAACSSSDSGGGGGASGLHLPGFGKAAGTGGGAGAAAPGTTGGATSCPLQGGEDPCTVCAYQSCCGELTTCANNQTCASLLNCYNACPDEACLTTCDMQYRAGVSPLETTLACVYARCPTQCGDGTAGAGGANGAVGTTGGTASGGSSSTALDPCLMAASKDPSYCPDPARPWMRDCPNGSPSSSCELSPTNAANLFCCSTQQ